MQYNSNITKRIALAVIILVIVISTAFFFLNYTKQGAIWKATSFAKNEETYKFDGIEETFKVKDVLTLRCPCCWSVEIEYQSKSSGYGNRSNQVVAKVITAHTARIMVNKGNIMYSILDEEWDMINQVPVEHAKEEER